MLQNSTVAQSATGPTIQFLKILAPFVGGSIATLLGTAFQRRLSKRDERIEELYEPLYRRIDPFSDGELEFREDTSRVESVWDGIDHHQRRGLTDELHGDVAEIEAMVDSLNEFFRHLKDAIAENCTTRNVLMRGSSMYPSIAYKKNGGHTQAYSLDSWVRQYYAAVLSADDAEDLEARLSNEASKTGTYHQQAIESWTDSDFRDLGEAIVEAEEQLRAQSDFTGASDLYDALQSESEATARKIDEQVNKSAFRSYVPFLMR